MRPPAPPTAPARAGADQPRPITSIHALRHPYEASRFALAAVAAAAALIVVALILAKAGIGALVGALLVIVVSIWIGLQLQRARLLGRAVRVTPETFPELQALLERVRAQLDYHRPIDVYVIDKAEPAVSLTNFLGTRIILIEGSLAAELLEPDKRAQLVFLLATVVGALKAKHTRLDLALVLLEAANALQFVKPFLLPYYRAITYSGDQIGLACCGSLEAALQVTRRLLVGKELAPELAVDSVLPQALLVRHGVATSVTQWFARAPHVTSRYLNLLAFGRVWDPATWDRLRSSLDASGQKELDEVWQLSPHRAHGTAPSRPAGPAAVPPPPPPPRPEVPVGS